jgi:hypothetical protein
MQISMCVEVDTSQDLHFSLPSSEATLSSAPKEFVANAVVSFLGPKGRSYVSLGQRPRDVYTAV